VDDAYDAIVLAGGASRRLGGTDKLSLEVGGRTLLDRVLDACSGARTVAAVGPRRPTRGEVSWCREEPPGGGPVAAIAAGLARSSAPVVVVLAGDLPFVTRPLVDRLVEAVSDGDGAVLVDAGEHRQPLAGAYRRAALLAALGGLGSPADKPVHRLVAPLRLAHVPDREAASADCDTWQDVRAARAREGARSTGREPDRAGGVDRRPRG
jgi:molybdopterin-guanine dinucleotide biosynthesis protein A